MVASGSSAMSMAVTGFCCALDVWAQMSSAPKPVTSAAKTFKYLCIEISLFGRSNGSRSRIAFEVSALIVGVRRREAHVCLWHSADVDGGAERLRFQE